MENTETSPGSTGTQTSTFLMTWLTDSIWHTPFLAGGSVAGGQLKIRKDPDVGSPYIHSF